MYLAEIFAENFRVFGSEADNLALRLRLQSGLNALIGENDGGKSAIIDAVRYCLWTTSQDYHRISRDDFHCTAQGRTASLVIRCKFDDLSIDDQSAFLEWLSPVPNGEPVLYVHLRATRFEGRRQGRVAVETHSGEHGEGPAVEGMMRELLKTTYLRPLRDAEAELSPGRNSRLSQILVSHPEIADQETDDFDPATKDSGKTLVGILKRAEHEVGQNAAIISASTKINEQYLSNFRLGPEPLMSEVGVAGDTTLGRILEKLELVIAKRPNCAERTRRGLGYNNALFMSAELLLLGSREAYPTLLIEEPEAHLHPQMQASVMSLLVTKAASSPAATPAVAQVAAVPAVAQVAAVPAVAQVAAVPAVAQVAAVPAVAQVAGTPAETEVAAVDVEEVEKPVQVLVTTHSPNIASAIPLERITIVSGGGTYSLAAADTMLSASDYSFLERFLDVTKANLFFARGVAIVEGDAENILLPMLAEKVGYSFTKNGISVVNVGHVGLFRYSNIFRRQDGSSFPIPVACFRDRDIVPDAAPDPIKGKLKSESDLDQAGHTLREAKFKAGDGGSVKTFVSDHWTLEYDLAVASWKFAGIMHSAVQCAIAAESTWPDEAKIATIVAASEQEVAEWTANLSLEAAAILIYTPLRMKDASKTIAARFASQFVRDADLTVSDLPAYLVAGFRHLTRGDGDAAAA